MGVVVHVDSQIAQVLEVVERIGQVPELVFEEARTEAGCRGPLLEPMLSRDDVQSAVSIHVGDGNRFADPQIKRMFAERDGGGPRGYRGDNVLEVVRTS